MLAMTASLNNSLKISLGDPTAEIIALRRSFVEAEICTQEYRYLRTIWTDCTVINFYIQTTLSFVQKF
jgi:hypothetical protein